MALLRHRQLPRVNRGEIQTVKEDAEQMTQVEYYRQCQRAECKNAVEGKARFCSAKCRTADWKARLAIAAKNPSDICSACGQARRGKRRKAQRSAPQAA